MRERTCGAVTGPVPRFGPGAMLATAPGTTPGTDGRTGGGKVQAAGKPGVWYCWCCCCWCWRWWFLYPASAWCLGYTRLLLQHVTCYFVVYFQPPSNQTLRSHSHTTMSIQCFIDFIRYISVARTLGFVCLLQPKDTCNKHGYSMINPVRNMYIYIYICAQRKIYKSCSVC